MTQQISFWRKKKKIFFNFFCFVCLPNNTTPPPFVLFLLPSMKLVIFACLVVATLASDPLIAFIANQNGFPEIAVVSSDGSSAPRILTDMRTEHVEHPRLSHSQQKIVFSSDYESKFPILYTIDVAGGKPKPLTASVRGPQIAADWSPDDSMLVMEEIHSATEFTRLVLIDAEGTSRFPLMESEESHNDFFARWAPHGEEILFLSDRSAFHPDFYVFDLNDIESISARKLPHLPPLVHYPMGNGPSISPSGDEIIFEEERDAHFVNLVQTSMHEEDPKIRELFSVDVIHRPNDLNDLSLSQCVYSPQPASSYFCCRYLRANDSKGSLAIVSKEGTIVRTLTPETMSASAPSWK